MSNAEQRVLHGTSKTDQELRLTFANRRTEDMEVFARHYDTRTAAPAFNPRGRPRMGSPQRHSR